MHKKSDKRKSERGSAIFIILIGITLFAALSYTIANMMRSGNTQAISEEQAGLYASQIIEYSNTIRSGVQDMLINGCDETEISFTRESGDDYEHSPASPDKCKLFSRDGAGVNYTAPSEDINDGSDYIFTSEHIAQDVGSNCTDGSCSELIMVLENLRKNICLAINDKLHIDNPSDDAPNDVGGAMSKFTGTFSYGNVLFDEDTALTAQTAGCFRDTPGNTYSYFKVLIAR